MNEACASAATALERDLDALAAAAGTLEPAGEWLLPGECLRRMAQHFIDTWEPALTQQSTPQRKVLVRDRGFCMVRAAAARPRMPITCGFRSAGR